MPMPARVSEDPNSRGRIALIAIFAGISATLLLMAPAVASQLQVQLNLSPTQTGDLFAVELGAMSLASLPALYWIKNFNLRMTSLALGAIFIGGNITSSYMDSYGLLVVVRGLTSLAGGSLMVLTMTLAAQAKNRDRVFGLWTVGQIALGALGLGVLPRFFDTLGIAVVYWTLAVLMLLALPLVRFLPQHGTKPSPAGTQGIARVKPPLVKIGAALVACLIFYIGLIAVWTFTGGIAQSAGIEPPTASLILSLATVVGVVGSFAATLVGGTVNRRIVLWGGYLGMILAVTLLFGVDNTLRFGAAALIFKFAWPWTLPFLMSTLADLDPSGRATNLANLFIGGGLAIGPFIAGRLIDATGGYEALTLLSAPALIVSLVLILVAQPSRESSRAPGQAQSNPLSVESAGIANPNRAGI